MVKLVSNKENKEIEEAISEQDEHYGVSEVDSIGLDDPEKVSDKDSENIDEEDSSIEILDDLFKNVEQFIVSSDESPLDAVEPQDSEKKSVSFNSLDFDFTQDKRSPDEKAKTAPPESSEKKNNQEDNLIEPEGVEPEASPDSPPVISAKAKNEADFQAMNPFGKATYLLAGSLVNGVSQLLLGSAQLMGQAGKKFSSNLGQVPLMSKEASLSYADEVGKKLKEAKFNESMEGIHAIENLSGFFEEKLFNEFNAYLGKSNELSIEEKQKMSSTFIERYGKHFPDFKKAMHGAELLIRDSQSKLDFFAKNLDDSEESKNKFITYIERLESLRDRVPPWFNVGKTNVVSFLDQLLEKAKELFFSKFGVAHDNTSNPQMN